MTKDNDGLSVRTASRLHFGLLSFPADEAWPDRTGAGSIPSRQFGGVGLMLEAPGVCLSVRAAPDWSATGPLADRVLEYARRFARTVPADTLPPQRLTVEQCPPEHAGLGTGTQLALAVARGLAAACGRGDWDAVELARRVGR